MFATVHDWDAPNVRTCETRSVIMPITDHPVRMARTPSGTGGTTTIWRWHFNTTGSAMRHVVPTVMTGMTGTVGMMHRGMAALVRDLGGRAAGPDGAAAGDGCVVVVPGRVAVPVLYCTGLPFLRVFGFFPGSMGSVVPGCLLWGGMSV